MLSARQLHSAVGIAPLGSYLLFHLWENLAVISGRDDWLDRLYWSRSRFGTEMGLAVAASLAVHVFSSLRRRDRAAQHLLGSGGLRALQRVTGGIGLVFVVFHVYQVCSPQLGPEIVALGAYDVLQSALGSPLSLVIYAVGVTSLYFHFAHGICRAAVTWRLVSTPQGMRRVRYAAGCFGMLLWSLTLEVLAHLSIGERLFG